MCLCWGRFHPGAGSVGAGCSKNLWFSYSSNKAPTPHAQGDTSNIVITIPTPLAVMDVYTVLDIYIRLTKIWEPHNILNMNKRGSLISPLVLVCAISRNLFSSLHMHTEPNRPNLCDSLQPLCSDQPAITLTERPDYSTFYRFPSFNFLFYPRVLRLLA